MRVVLRVVNLELTGFVAAASVEVMHGNCKGTGKVVGRNAPERHSFLVAGATARALTELFPRGFGIVLQNVYPVTSEVIKALSTVVLFLTPTREELLLGIAQVDDSLPRAAAKAVLNAVNRRIEFWLHEGLGTKSTANS